MTIFLIIALLCALGAGYLIGFALHYRGDEFWTERGGRSPRK